MDYLLPRLRYSSIIVKSSREMPPITSVYAALSESVSDGETTSTCGLLSKYNESRHGRRLARLMDAIVINSSCVLH